MDLIGIPVRITVGKKVEENQVEIKLRTSDQSDVIEIEKAIDRIQELCKI